MFIKPLELKLKVCTSATSWLVDLKSTVLAYTGKAAKLYYLPNTSGPKCLNSL